MLFNRAIQMKLVKPAVKELEGAKAAEVQNYVQIARELGFEAGKGIAILIAGYVAIDTVRQVIVTVVDNKTR